jgi:hypothetical protein
LGCAGFSVVQLKHKKAKKAMLDVALNRTFFALFFRYNGVPVAAQK